jgi:hypothetical protein
MPTQPPPATAPQSFRNQPDLAAEAHDQVNTILARTDWQQYWSDVSDQAEGEINAYDAACARSLANASRKFVQ